MPDCIFGNGSTITFSGGFTASFQQLSGLPRSVAVADVTPLSQGDGTWKKKKASRRYEHEPVTGQFFFDPDVSLPSLGTEQDLTITYPGGSRQLTGRGFIVDHDTGELISDEVAVGSVAFQFKGGTASGEEPLISNV